MREVGRKLMKEPLVSKRVLDRDPTGVEILNQGVGEILHPFEGSPQALHRNQSV